MGGTERYSSCVRPRDPEGRGGEHLQRPHAYQRIADEDNDLDLTKIMVLKRTSPDKDFEIYVPVAEEKESYALPCRIQSFLRGCWMSTLMTSSGQE